MLSLLLIAAFIALIAYGVSRSPVGQRYKGEFSPRILRIAKRRPPATIRTRFGLTTGWLMRRIYPVLSGIAAFKIAGLMTGHAVDSVPLSTTTWVTLAAGCAALWTAAWAFSDNKRNGPLSLWIAWISACGTVAMGVLFFLLALGYSTHLLGVLTWLPITTALDTWSSGHSIEDAAGVSITLIGLGVAILALQESAPMIGHPTSTPMDLQLGKSITSQDAPTVAPRKSRGSANAQGKSKKRRKRKARSGRR
jgi:hypothetical protein